MKYRLGRTPEMRFWMKVNKDGPNGCWTWTAQLSKAGYGRFRPDPYSNTGAHRYSYELHKGPIPKGLDIDHLCCNPSCVNPDHLEAVTTAENLRRVEERGRSPNHYRHRTHCPKGHPLSGDNLYVARASNGGKARHCKRCRADQQAAWRERHGRWQPKEHVAA